MPFHEVLFSERVSYGSSGGPKFKTTIFTADSGYEQRNIDWQNVRSEYDASQGIRDTAAMQEIRAFFYARRGRAFGFRYKDWGDYQIREQVIDVGDGVSTAFQIVKTYRSQQSESDEAYIYERKITKINWDSITVIKVDGVPLAADAWVVDHNTGIITFDTAPAYQAPIEIVYAEFHVPVRFDTDHLDVAEDFWNTESWNSIPLVEVRDWEEVVT